MDVTTVEMTLSSSTPARAAAASAAAGAAAATAASIHAELASACAEGVSTTSPARLPPAGATTIPTGALRAPTSCGAVCTHAGGSGAGCRWVSVRSAECVTGEVAGSAVIRHTHTIPTPPHRKANVCDLACVRVCEFAPPPLPHTCRPTSADAAHPIASSPPLAPASCCPAPCHEQTLPRFRGGHTQQRLATAAVDVATARGSVCVPLLWSCGASVSASRCNQPYGWVGGYPPHARTLPCRCLLPASAHRSVLTTPARADAATCLLRAPAGMTSTPANIKCLPPTAAAAPAFLLWWCNVIGRCRTGTAAAAVAGPQKQGATWFGTLIDHRLWKFQTWPSGCPEASERRKCAHHRACKRGDTRGNPRCKSNTHNSIA